jgi:hypothetical protein
MKVSSRAEMLPKNLIVCLPVQDLNGRGFGGLLSQTAMHAVARMGKSRGRRNKRNIAREIVWNAPLQIWSSPGIA